MNLFTPRYWLLWIGIGIFWCISRFPYSWQLAIGRQLGRIGHRLVPRRRHIADVNLKLCFPELDTIQRHRLLRQHFESLGMGLIETFGAWWLSNETLQPLEHIQGYEHLQAALKKGKGVILLGAHFTSLEISNRFLTQRTAIHIIYRTHENPLIEQFMKEKREHYVEKTIPREAIRDMLRSLKHNKTVWFASDQNFGHKNSVFADFFGVPASTNTAVSRLAKISGAAVVPFFMQRLKNNQGYQINLQPALDNFPSGDPQQDAVRINKLIELEVRKVPEQYFWVHRRFKNRPNDEPSVYQ